MNDREFTFAVLFCVVIVLMFYGILGMVGIMRVLL